MNEKIEVLGARVHNLKNVDVTIPRNSLTVFTGLSGSGKSSLAFDTIFAEGQRRYIETFSAYARNFLGNLERPDVDKISGLSPVISIEQKTTNKNPRSTVGTTTEIYDYLRLLFARAGEAYSYMSGEKMVKYTEEKVVDMIPVFWNVDSLDWKLQNKEQVLSCLSGQVEEGDVILMHDGYRSSVDAAFALVDHLQKQGFVFVNVEEMVLE